MQKIYLMALWSMTMPFGCFASQTPEQLSKVQEALCKSFVPQSVPDRLATLCAEVRMLPHEVFGLSDQDMRTKYASSSDKIKQSAIEEILFLRHTPAARNIRSTIILLDAFNIDTTFTDPKMSERKALEMKVQAARIAAQKRSGRR